MLSLLHAVTLATLLAQEAPVHAYASRYEDAFEEATNRNVPVVLMGWDNWSDDPDRGYRFSDWYKDRSFLRATEKAVLILVSQTQHREKAQLVGGEEKRVCSRYGGIQCGIHLRMMANIVKDFAREDGSLIVPLFLVANPDREVVARFEHETPIKEFLPALTAAQKSLGQGLSRLDYLQMKSGLTKARKAVELKEHRRAWSTLRQLAEIPGDGPMHRDLDATRKQLFSSGQKIMEEAEASWEQGRHLQALLSLDQVAFDFEASEIGKRAGITLKKLQKTEEGKPHSRTVKNTREARALYEKGMEQDEAGDFKRALSTLERLIRKHPESLFADKARPLVDLLKARR